MSIEIPTLQFSEPLLRARHLSMVDGARRGRESELLAGRLAAERAYAPAPADISGWLP
jgi:hypothetical protein